jgi:hypothetical protein
MKIQQHKDTYFFKRPFDPVPDCFDFFVLTQTMDSTECLLFHHRIPLRFEEVCDRSCSEIKSERTVSICQVGWGRLIAGGAEKKKKWSTDPAPPQVMDTRMTWILSSVWNF